MVCIYIPDFTGSCGADSTFGPWASQDTFGTPVPLNVGRYRLDPGARARWLARGRCTGSGTTRMRTSPSSSSVIGPFSGHLRMLPSKRPATAVRVKEVRRQPS